MGGMGSDVGAGTTYEMARVMGDLYMGWENRPATLEEIANGYDFPGGGSYPGYSSEGTGDVDTSIPYKRKYKPYPLSQLYLMTLATADVMGIGTKVGSFQKGMEADFVVSDLEFSPIYNWNRKVTEDFLMEQLMEDAENSIAAFKSYTNSDLKHVKNLTDYFWLEKAFLFIHYAEQRPHHCGHVYYGKAS